MGIEGSRSPGRGLAPGAVVLGYTIEGQIGRGAMGIVYRARDAQGRPAAVKVVIGLDGGGSRRERFSREVEAARALDHPGVVRMYAADLAGFTPLLVMEWVDGRGLDAVLADAAVSRDERLELVLQLCRAIAHAHERRIVHRDLKPQNVLVTKDGRVKVTDFGLARDLGRETRLTETGSMLGTPAWMAPELVRGDTTAGPPVDVWALGVILQEALTGARPFEGVTVVDLMHRILFEPPALPSSQSPDCGPEHDAVVRRALAKEPAERPTALELGREVARLRAGRRAVPRGPGPIVVVALAVALVLLGAGAVVVASAPEGSPPSGAASPPPATPPAPTTRTTPTPPTTTPTLPAPTSPTPPTPTPPTPPTPTPAPGSPAGLRARARAALAAWDGPRAREACVAALAIDPGDLEALLLQARARDLEHDWRGAAQDLAGVIEAASRDQPDLAYEACLLRCPLLTLVGGPARDELSRAIALRPGRWEAPARRGLLDLYSGLKDRSPSCREDVARAVLLGPHEAEALRGAATLLWDDARDRKVEDPARADGFTAAEAAFARALAADPDDAETLGLRAWLWRDRKEVERERADLERAWSLFEAKDDLARRFVREARESRARWVTSGRDDDIELAVELASRARAENMRHPGALAEQSIAGFLDWQAGLNEARPEDRARIEARGAEVRKALDWALRVNRCAAGVAYHRGLLLLSGWSGRDPEQALLAFNAALPLAPEDAAVLLARAQALLELGRPEGALADCARARALAPDRPEGWTLGAQALRALARDADAEGLLHAAPRR